jgi:hypothetical protein
MKSRIQIKYPEIELRPDGWDRFKVAVSAAAKAGPMHRPAKKQAKKSKSGSKSPAGHRSCIQITFLCGQMDFGAFERSCPWNSYAMMTIV